MDPLPRRRKEGGGEIVEVYGFAGWIASLVAYGEQQVHLNAANRTQHVCLLIAPHFSTSNGSQIADCITMGACCRSNDECWMIASSQET